MIHPAGHALLPWFVARGISANAVSVGGLVLGLCAAFAYSRWAFWPFALVGLLLSIGWLIADGLDGMIARATGTASPLGRILDGVCDHGVFILIYVALAATIGTLEAWALAIAAGAAHAVQSNLYESERARFHRRCKGIAVAAPVPSSGNFIVRLYDRGTTSLDRFAFRFDDALSRHANPAELADAYGTAAARPMRLVSLLSANMRIYAIFLACLFGNPRLFWWFELVPLNIILVAGLIQHRAVEGRLIAFGTALRPSAPSSRTSSQRT